MAKGLSSEEELFISAVGSDTACFPWKARKQIPLMGWGSVGKRSPTPWHSKQLQLTEQKLSKCLSFLSTAFFMVFVLSVGAGITTRSS